MIHTKLLIRRLAYVPWLLAFGLMLGWAGEAQAQITLTLDKSSVREEAGATTITVTAQNKSGAALPDVTNIVLDWGETAEATTTAPAYGAGTKAEFGNRKGALIDSDNDGDVDDPPTDAATWDRYLISLPSLQFAKGAANDAKVTGEITFTPLDDNIIGNDHSPAGDDENIRIWIVGTAGTAGTVTGASFVLIDNDQPTQNINISFDPASLSEESGPERVKVTATVDGRPLGKTVSFDVVLNNAGIDPQPPARDPEPLGVRDVDYSLVPNSLSIPRGKVSGSTYITIDPRVKDRDLSETSQGAGDAVDVTAVQIGLSGSPNSFNAAGSEDTALKNANPDGTQQAITVGTGVFKVNDTPLAKPKGLDASPNVVREEAGTTEISLKVTLEKELPNDEVVDFTIVATGDADDLDGDGVTDASDEDGLEPFFDGVEPAERDVDYTASFSELTIQAGSTEGTAMLTLTPIDNDDIGAAVGFRVIATVGNNQTSVDGIKIVDNETPTTTITLSASPAEATAGAGETDITITGEINGATFEDPTVITLVLDPKDGNTTAQRDTDFTAALTTLTIEGEAITGSTNISITALTGGDKKVQVKALKNPRNNQDDDPVTVSPIQITLKDAPAAEEATDPGALAFESDIGATIFGFVVGEEKEMDLPDVTGGAAGDRTYATSALPDGLSFDEDALTISGSPTEEGETTVIYTVIDSEGASVAATVMVKVDAAPPPMAVVESVSVSRSSIRESGDTASISVKATLAEPAPVAETIRFTLGAPSEGVQAIRDVDFSASLHGNVAIAEGATEATTSLTLTPIDNMNEDGNRVIGVHATASGGSASADITIADDETASTSISLSADPHTVGENADITSITITATLDGKVLDAAATVSLSIDSGSEATRDVDYRAVFNPTLTIPAGAVSGSVDLLLQPLSDSDDEGNETITLVGAIDGLADGSGLITIADYEMMDPGMEPLAFAEGAMIDAIEATAGTAIADVVLPEATVGMGDITYSTSELPAGLSFDAETRTLSGTPEAEGTTEVTYTATSGDASVDLTFSITVNPMLDFGDLGALFGLFNEGAGKANPAQDDGSGALQLTVGVPVELTLPEIPGGTGQKTYSMSGLPAGLSFDAATRTISGTPTEEGAAIVILTVTDAVGATGQVPFPVEVVQPPLSAPGNLVAEDYRGADGQGDQGGFVMLSWELSDQHDSIDGYRIFRALPVLGNEMVPWAMVDAVPGVERGVAIVATLDNVSTRWGIAAESGGRTTHGAAKAVFASGDNPYELMAETMTASREAAQAGDGPVFATLLPEALAYAQGVAPKLNLIGSVISSAVTMTEEPVRAIDNIAPLAVPSLSVLDAPNDQGNRIVLTWTLSPSDQLLQGVIAGAIGPTSVEPVVGVHGYSIHRRAAGEDEFVNIAQVDAGVTSYVDETALNGVHYTYQVRPFDLDNETGSDIEQTAMAVRNSVLDSEGRAIFGLFGADNRIGFDDFFIFADNFGLTAEDAGFDPAFDLAPSAAIDFDDFFVFADNFGRSIAAAGKRVPMLAGMNADARMYLDARTALPNVGEDFVLDVRLADFVAVKGYGLQVQYEADKLEFVQVLTDQPLGGSELATPQVLADQAGVLTVAAHGDIVSDGEVMLSLVFRPTTEIENTVIEITDNQAYDSEFGFNRLALPAPVQLQTRPEVFSLANNYPNPFNPATTIKYALPQAADVQLTVYNVLGQPVRTLVAEHQNAGRYVVEWDATNDNGHSLSSGMYFYRLEAGGEFLEVKKMLLLK